MKIFNWVHSRFHQKDEAGRDMKNDGFVKNDRHRDSDTLVLLEHVALTNPLDIWKDGILTIGTLGFPLYDLDKLNQTKGYFLEKENNQEQEHKNSIDDILGKDDRYDHEVDHEEEDGETDPLVFKASKHGFNSQFHHELDVDGTGDHLDTCTNELNSNPNDQVGGDISEIEETRKKRGERITLADLFSADSDMKKKPDRDDEKDLADNIGKKVALPAHAKKGISFPKKFIPRVKADSRPIQKLHKLMTKMLKRKIHPDLEGKTQIISRETADPLGVVNKDERGGVESLCLLQAQVATA